MRASNIEGTYLPAGWPHSCVYIHWIFDTFAEMRTSREWPMTFMVFE